MKKREKQTYGFNRALIALIAPIAFQNLISAAVSSADIVMLGMISQSAMSAISLAGQVTFVLTLFYMGLSTGAGILTAQYWGKNDTGAIRRVLSIACMFSVCISLIIGHVSADMVAANSIATVVRNLAVVLCGGIAGGGSILVGKYLGIGDMQAAKKVGNRLYLYAFIFGVLAGVSILLMKPLVFRMVDLSDTAHTYLNGMLYICAVYCIGKSLNSVLIGGIFCAGGDSKFGFWCDLIVMWGIIIPLGYLYAFVWKVPPVMLYMVLCLDEFIKLPAAALRFYKYRWLKNITRDFS